MNSKVNVQGNMLATIKDGRIVNFTFIPHDANAGFFGDGVSVMDGDFIDKTSFYDLVGDALMFSWDEKSAHFTCEWES